MKVMVLPLLLLAAVLHAADFRPPVGNRPAARRPGAVSILPGGRVIAPFGKQYATGPGPFGLAVNPSGKLIVTADGGPNRYSLSFLEKERDVWRTRHLVAPKNKEEEDDTDEADWRSVFLGLAFEDDRDLFASEGNSGFVRFIDARNGNRKHRFDLNQGPFRDSYSG